MYELNNRPSWVRIPLAGILALAAKSLWRIQSVEQSARRTS